MNKLMRMLLLLLFFLAFSFCLFQVNQSSISANSYVRCKDQTLILDAGHGGEDGGAVSVSGVPESGINLSIVLKMDQFAGLYGVHTLLIRTSDTSIAVARPRHSGKKNAVIFTIESPSSTKPKALF